MADERPGLHYTEWACELAGTAILLVGGLSAVTLDFAPGSPVAARIPSASARLLLTGLLFAGTGSLVAITPLGRRSGAHLNPAVTLAFYLTRHVHLKDLAGYCAAQLVGALVGAGLVQLVWGARADSVNLGATMPSRSISDWQAAGIEAGMTALLVLTIFAFTSRKATMRWTPVAVWILIACLVWQVAPLTGTSLNPARSLGPAAVLGHYGHLWIYVAGPLTGATLAALAAHLLPSRLYPLTAKLFHDARYPNPFRWAPHLFGTAHWPSHP